MFSSKKNNLIVLSLVVLCIIVLISFFYTQDNNTSESNTVNQILSSGWIESDKAALIRECLDEGESSGSCECYVEILTQEFDNLNDFNQKFDNFANYLLRAIFSNQDIDSSIVNDLANKIRLCP